MLLQIDITGRDATGGTAAATIEVEVADPGAAPSKSQIMAEAGWMSVPPGATAAHAAATFPGPDVQADAGPAAPPPSGGEAHAGPRMMAAGPEAPHVVQAMETPIPGLTNSTGHKGATSDFVPPKVTQAQRSMTLGRFTGGYR